MVKNFFHNGASFLFKKQTSILSAAVILMITYAGSMILGILRERILIANFYSCCKESLDAYYAAFRLPDMIFQLVVIGALSAAFLPVFSEQLEKDEKIAYKISSSLVNLLTLVYLLLAGVIFVFADQISGFITGGFSSSQIGLMANLTRIMLFAQGFFLVSNFLTAIIQSHQRFIIPAIAPLLYNLGIIFSVLLLGSQIGIWSAAVGVVIGAFFHLLIQIPLAIKLGFSYEPIFNFRLPGVKEVFRLMLPRTLGLAVYQIEATVSVFLATSLSAGSLTIFYLAQKLMDLPVRLFGTSIGQASLPSLSSLKAKGDLQQFKETLVSSLGQVLYFSLPSMAMILVLRIPLVRIAYGAKTFPWQATVLTGRVVALISLAIFSQSATQLLVRAFYAIHNTRIPLKIGALSVLVNVFLGVLSVFKYSWGILGLSAATSISSLLQASLLFIFLQKKIGTMLSAKVVNSWGKMIFATILAGFSFWGMMKFLDLFILDTAKTVNLLFLTLVSCFAGVAAYFLLTKALKLEEADKFLEVFKKIKQFKKVFLPPQEILESSRSNPT